MSSKSINTKIVISELHRAFKMFNENLFDGGLPEPAILIQSRGNKKLTLGWCSVAKIWKNEKTEEEKYEINIVAEALNRGVYPVMTTLLHEMVHLHNLVNGIKDTSRGNTYHNMKFKTTAEAHGLLVTHADKIGWSVSKLNGLTMDLIDSYEFSEEVFSLGRRDLDFEGAGKPRKKKKSSSRKYKCPLCGTSIRASKDVNILCGDCTDIEEDKIVLMIKEITEDDFEDGEDEEDEDNDSPEEDENELVCPDCGCISKVDKGVTICPECWFNVAEGEAKEEPIEEPARIVEVDKTLIDCDGKEVEVKQGIFKAVKTEWSIAEIGKVINSFETKVNEELGTDVAGEFIFEISEKLNSQWAKYVEGQKMVFSKSYLEEASDEDIIDTIKHQYLHHYQWEVQGLKMNHRKEFKALCEQFGLETKIPTKNHRAMK